MGRGLSQLQRGLLTHLELSQMNAATAWGEESRQRWDQMPKSADSARKEALKQMGIWGGPLDKTARWAAGMQGPGTQQQRIADAQRDWDRAERYAAEYAEGPALMRPEDAYASYGSLLRLLNPSLPLNEDAQREIGWRHGSDWDRYRRAYQLSGYICDPCPERESRQAALRRALIRLEDRGLICRRDAKAWLPDLLPGIALQSQPEMPTSGETIWERIERDEMEKLEARRQRIAALKAGKEDARMSGGSRAEQLLAAARARASALA